MTKKDKDLQKLGKYLKHWADHSESHKEKYIEWQRVAESKGWDQIGEKLKNAIARTDEAIEELLSAYDSLEERE